MTIAHRVSAFNRKRKWQQFLTEMKPTATTTILNVGFSAIEHSPTDNFLERNYSYPENITSLGIDALEDYQRRYPKVTAVQYDGRIFPFADQFFDICWSNAVLEHVGDEAQQISFLREINRVAKRVFITTPNRYFPIEVHTRTPLLHWLPKPMFDKYLRLTGQEWAAGDYMNLLSAADLKRMCARSGLQSCELRRNRLVGLTLDFVVSGPSNEERYAEYERAEVGQLYQAGNIV